MLELKNVNAGYGKKMVLSDVSVRLNDNTITVVMGPNGAGKSTLLKTAYGLIKTSSGDILLDDKKIVPTPQKLVEYGIFMLLRFLHPSNALSSILIIFSDKTTASMV